MALYDSLCCTTLLWAMEIGLGAVGESVSVGFPGVLMKSVESKRVVRVQNVAFERKRGIVLDGC